MTTQSSVPAAAETAGGRDEGNTSPVDGASAGTGFLFARISISIRPTEGPGRAAGLCLSREVEADASEPVENSPVFLHVVVDLPIEEVGVLPHQVVHVFAREKSALNEQLGGVGAQDVAEWEAFAQRLRDAVVGGQYPITQLRSLLGEVRSAAGVWAVLRVCHELGLDWSVEAPNLQVRFSRREQHSPRASQPLPKSPYLYDQPVSTLRVEETGELTVGGLLALLKNAGAGMTLPVRLELRKGETGRTYDGDLEGLCVVREHVLGEPTALSVVLCGRSE